MRDRGNLSHDRPRELLAPGLLLSVFSLLPLLIVDDGQFLYLLGVFGSIVLHPVPNLLLDFFELTFRDELRERIDLLLIEERHEVVAEPPHLAVPVRKHLFIEPESALFLDFCLLLQPYYLHLRLCEGPLAHVFFKH